MAATSSQRGIADASGSAERRCAVLHAARASLTCGLTAAHPLALPLALSPSKLRRGKGVGGSWIQPNGAFLLADGGLSTPTPMRWSALTLSVRLSVASASELVACRCSSEPWLLANPQACMGLSFTDTTFCHFALLPHHHHHHRRRRLVSATHLIRMASSCAYYTLSCQHRPQ